MAASRTIATATPRSKATKTLASRLGAGRGHGENPAGASWRGFCLGGRGAGARREAPESASWEHQDRTQFDQVASSPFKGPSGFTNRLRPLPYACRHLTMKSARLSHSDFRWSGDGAKFGECTYRFRVSADTS